MSFYSRDFLLVRNLCIWYGISFYSIILFLSKGFPPPARQVQSVFTEEMFQARPRAEPSTYNDLARGVKFDVFFFLVWNSMFSFWNYSWWTVSLAPLWGLTSSPSHYTIRLYVMHSYSYLLVRRFSSIYTLLVSCVCRSMQSIVYYIILYYSIV